MRVRMLGTVSGTRNGADWPPRGGCIDLPDDEATALVAIGMAEHAPAEVVADPQSSRMQATRPEAAVVGLDDAETADAARPRARSTGGARK